MGSAYTVVSRKQRKTERSNSTDALNSGYVARLLEPGASHIQMASNTVPEVAPEVIHNRSVPKDTVVAMVVGMPDLGHVKRLTLRDHPASRDAKRADLRGPAQSLMV